MQTIKKLFGPAICACALAFATASAGAKSITLAYVAAGLQYPFNVAIGKGFQDAAKEAGVRAVVLDGKASVGKQGDAIEDLITQGVDGIVILPIDGIVAQGWADRTASHNIPLVSVMTEIGDPQKRQIRDVYAKSAALVASDELRTGAVAGEIAAKLVPKDRVAQIAIVEGAPGYSQVWQRTAGFKQGLDAAGVKYRIVAAQPTDWTPEQGEYVCQNILQAHPDVDVFYNQADDMMIGCAKAVRASGSHAKLVGWGGSRVGINAVKAGEADGTVCVQPEKVGRLAFKALYATVTKPETPKAQFVEVDTPPVTRANLASCAPQW